MTTLLASYVDSVHTGLISRIYQTWNNPIRTDIWASMRGAITHRKWILDRVAQIGLPFAVMTPVFKESMPMPEALLKTEP